MSWYNTQFYCGWGDARNRLWYEAILSAGWSPARVVLGLITSPANGSGFIDLTTMTKVLADLETRYPDFGGVMGWEYFNCEPGGEERPWEWANIMTEALALSSSKHRQSRGTNPITSSEPPQLPFRTADVDNLLLLGCERMQAFAALIQTAGNVEMAASILFEQQEERSALCDG